MINKDEPIEISKPKNQLNLYGYKNYFNLFIKLFEKNKLPNIMLLSGEKGLGKSTFSYHFINYLLSFKEKNSYSVGDNQISSNNKSYISLNQNVHSNFFLVENKDAEESIKIESIRSLLKFLNKTSYNSDIKIVLVDNAEYLNKNSANALLKSLEEPAKNTFFFIIHNNAHKILDTVKSRCIEFRFFFEANEKIDVLENILKQYDYNFDLDKFDRSFLLNPPGLILRYIEALGESDIDFNNDLSSCIKNLMSNFKKKKEMYIFNLIVPLIEHYYSKKIENNNENLLLLSNSKIKILKQISDTKKYNLDKNNLFLTIEGILNNER